MIQHCLKFVFLRNKRQQRKKEDGGANSTHKHAKAPSPTRPNRGRVEQAPCGRPRQPAKRAAKANERDAQSNGSARADSHECEGRRWVGPEPGRCCAGSVSCPSLPPGGPGRSPDPRAGWRTSGERRKRNSAHWPGQKGSSSGPACCRLLHSKRTRSRFEARERASSASKHAP